MLNSLISKLWGRSPGTRSGSIENPNVPLSQASTESWFGFGGKTNSGIKVTHQSAMKVAAFWQGVTMLSGDVAKLPLEVYKRGEDTDRELFSGHPAYRVVRRQANQDQSVFEFRRQMMAHALVWGNAYAIIVRDGAGRVTELLPLLPDRTHAQRLPDGRLTYETEVNGDLKYFDAYDIWHLKGVSFDGINGLDVVRYARDGIGRILARENFASRFFKNGGRIGGILQLPWSKDKVKRQKKEDGFRRHYEDPDAAFKTVVMSDNAKFHAAQASFSDSQMVDVGKADIRHVARILNIPAHKLGAEGSTSYNSLEQENQAYYDNCLSHWLSSIESECWLKLFDKQTRDANQLYFEHTIGALLWADSKTVATIGSNGVRGGWLKPNEVRRWFNLNAADGGNDLLVPSGMVVAGQVETDNSDDSNVRSAIEAHASDVRQRFVKRLKVHARKAAKTSLSTWLQRHMEAEHLEIGRSMFEPVQTPFGQSAPDYAKQTIDDFRTAIEQAEDVTKFLEESK